MKSAQPKKQRKYLYTMPLHKRWHLFNAKVFDKEGNKLGRDRIKKGVLVKVMRGNFKGHIGKVVRIDRKIVRVYVEGCTRKTQRGTEVLVPIHPSNLCIIKGD